jgi:hypothetical protein
MNIRTITTIGIVILLSVGFVISNRMSYNDGLDDQAFRCLMIAEKTWPNVDGYFEKVCKS